MTDAELIELESAPETASYRHHRRMIWQVIRARFAEALAEPSSRGLVDEPGRAAAAGAVRGDIRSLMSELLTRAPVPAILRFLAICRRWGRAGERLLEHNDAVIDLLESAYPRPTWTTLESLDPQAAEDDARWTAWTTSWADAFEATGPAAHEVLTREPTIYTEPDTREKLPSLHRWAPWLASAAAIVAATTVIVVATRE